MADTQTDELQVMHRMPDGRVVPLGPPRLVVSRKTFYLLEGKFLTSEAAEWSKIYTQPKTINAEILPCAITAECEACSEFLAQTPSGFISLSQEQYVTLSMALRLASKYKDYGRAGELLSKFNRSIAAAGATGSGSSATDSAA